MPGRLGFLSDRLDALLRASSTFVGMDVLGDAVATMRTGEARAARAEWYAPWGQRFAPGPGAGFLVLLEGPCWLIPDEGDPVELGVGDVVFMPHGGGHALADDPSRALAAPSCDPMDEGSRFEERYAAPAAGRRAAAEDARGRTVTLCGAYRLDRSRAHPLLDDMPAYVHLPARGEARPELRAAVELLGAEIGRGRQGEAVVVPALLDVLLLYILRAWSEDGRTHGESITGWAAALGDPAVRGVLDAIHREPGAAWTVESLGRRAGLSRAAIARRFTALTGRPPLAYLTWWRMTLAARLLRESDAPVAKVAEHVGYTSEFAFARAFGREHGMPPGAYRRARAAVPGPRSEAASSTDDASMGARPA